MCSLVDQQLLVLDDEDRPAAAPRVGEEAQLAVGDVANDGDLGGDLDGEAQRAQRVTSLSGSWWMPTHAPLTKTLVDVGIGRGDLAEVLRAKEGGGGERGKSGKREDESEGREGERGGWGGAESEGTRRPLVEELEDGLGRGADRDVRHQREILHQPDRLPLGRLRRAHHPPVRVVQLARLRQLALAADRRVQPAEVRQRRRERQPVEHLRHPGAHQPGADFCCPQLPVASAYFNPDEIVLWRTACTGREKGGLVDAFLACTSFASLKSLGELAEELRGRERAHVRGARERGPPLPSSGGRRSPGRGPARSIRF